MTSTTATVCVSWEAGGGEGLGPLGLSLVSWGEEGAVTSSREDAILRLGNGSQGARQMERASRAGEREGEGGRMGEWERRDLKLEGTGGWGVGGAALCL